MIEEFGQVVFDDKPSEGTAAGERLIKLEHGGEGLIQLMNAAEIVQEKVADRGRLQEAGVVVSRLFELGDFGFQLLGAGANGGEFQLQLTELAFVIGIQGKPIIAL